MSDFRVPAECSRMEDNVLKSIKLFERIRCHYGGGSSKSSAINYAREEDKESSNQEVPMDTDEANMQEKIYKFGLSQDLMGFDREFG